MKLSSIATAILLQATSLSLLAVEPAATKAVKPVIDPLSGTNVVQMVVGLFLVLILVFAIAWLLRRVGGVSLTGSGALKVIAGMSMGARDRVVLLQVGDEQLLVGISPGRIQTLHVLDNPIEIEQSTASSTVFADKLSEVLRGGKK